MVGMLLIINSFWIKISDLNPEKYFIKTMPNRIIEKVRTPIRKKAKIEYHFLSEKFSFLRNKKRGNNKKDK